MGRRLRRRRRRHREALASAMPSCAGNTKINEASAMLLYEAPSGIAVFSFDGAYLNNSVKDFWADHPQLTLEFFLKYEMVSTPIDLTNEVIDDYLTKKLTRLCGSEKKLAVGSAQHKSIIETKLGITCLFVGVPDCEVINCSLKNPMRTLLPEEKSETNKMDRSLISKQLITALLQHNIDVKPEMVNKSIAELAHEMHDTKLREMELLKFFSILLKDFIVISGIDTKRWMLFQFATVPKMICCPESSYEIYNPLKIFSRVEYRKIEANASRYKTSFSKIGVLSVYEEVVSLHSKKCLLVQNLKSLLEKAKDVVREQTENVDYFKENKQAGDTGDDRKKLTASTPGLLENKQNGHTGTIEEKMNLPENGDTGVQSMDGDKAKPAPEGIPATSEIATASTPGLLESKQNGHAGTIKEKMNLPENRNTGVQSMNGDEVNPTSSDIPNSEQLKVQHTDTSVKKNPLEINGDDANYEKARDDIKVPANGGIPKSGQMKDQHTSTSVTKSDMIPEITSDDGKDEQAREAGAQSTGGDETIPASSDIPSFEQLKGQHSGTTVLV